MATGTRTAPTDPAPPERPDPDQIVEKDLPEPAPLRKLIGPSVILVGVGVASGEYILFPYIASVAGLAFLWAAVVGVAMQFFINMEIERYTLATGQTAITGFSRLWKPWGLIIVAARACSPPRGRAGRRAPRPSRRSRSAAATRP